VTRFLPKNDTFDNERKVYIVVSPTGKAYIGQTKQPLRRRWSLHCWHARKGTKNPLCAAIRKYGPGAFIVRTILVADSKEQMNRCERYLIAVMCTKSPAGYNLTDGGDGPTGFKYSSQQILEMSKRQRARVNSPGYVPPMLGKKFSKESRERCSLRRGERNSFFGKHHSAETRKKMRMLKVGRPLSEAHREHISKGLELAYATGRR